MTALTSRSSDHSEPLNSRQPRKPCARSTSRPYESQCARTFGLETNATTWAHNALAPPLRLDLTTFSAIVSPPLAATPPSEAEPSLSTGRAKLQGPTSRPRDHHATDTWTTKAREGGASSALPARGHCMCRVGVHRTRLRSPLSPILKPAGMGRLAAPRTRPRVPGVRCAEWQEASARRKEVSAMYSKHSTRQARDDISRTESPGEGSPPRLHPAINCRRTREAHLALRPSLPPR